MPESFDDVVNEYIGFVNRQVGVYMDALSGFSGNHARVSRQIHRIQKPKSSRTDKDGMPVIVWASYEDPTKPDVIHHQTFKADDYLAANSEQGSNEQQHSQAVLIFLFTYWEDEIRPRLMAIKDDKTKNINSDIMGDLRILRNVILHAKGILSLDKFKSFKKLAGMFVADKPVLLTYERMHKIFILIKQDCARMLLEWLGINNGLVKPEEIVDVAIQKKQKT